MSEPRAGKPERLSGLVRMNVCLCVSESIIRVQVASMHACRLTSLK